MFLFICANGHGDRIILATTTPDKIFPATATTLQDRIGASCPAFDMQAVCAGFVFALTTAQQYIENGAAKNVLVVGSETYSRIINWSDRSTAILFGDGAGAVVLSSDNTTGIMHSKILSDGRYLSSLHVNNNYINDQANIRIISAVAKRINLPMNKVILTIEKHGNTSAASIPLALDVAVRDGRIKKGDNLLFEGIGGGFSWGGLVIEY